MFKIVLTAAAFAVTALSVQASPTLSNIPSLAGSAILPIDHAASTQIIEETTRVEEVAYFCEWAWIYDYYGNWVTVWQCY